MYGKAPRVVDVFHNTGNEMMFYQGHPIKLVGQSAVKLEERLINSFEKIISTVCCDFIGEFGLDKFVSSYVYVCAKRLYQTKEKSFNREGWHTDGFMTEDITYLWSDASPTLFNSSDFSLTQDDVVSLQEMQEQADPKKSYKYRYGTLLQLDQYSVHRCEPTHDCIRSFLKITFSKDKFDRKGNTHNYLLDYNWEMKPRSQHRNIPQSKINP